MRYDDEIGRRYPHILFAKHWALSEKATYLLGRCDSMVDAISRMPLQPEYHCRLLDVSLVKGAQATTAIEGNTLTADEVERVAGGESLALSKQYQEKEVRNILDAMNSLLQSVAVDGHGMLITPELIKQFHQNVGRDLGEHFDALPGRFRQDARTVGPYRCPRPEDVVDLVSRLCEWLPTEFGFTSNRQTFSEAVIQAIVTHVYLEWIHPFGDGNGRTGRLLEFYILLRAGNPDIASHILSNFYNQTRPEYYRQLDRAGRDRDLTAFIEYALQGYHDGLVEVLEAVEESNIDVSWRYLIHARFAERPYKKKNVFKRRRRLALSMDRGATFTVAEVLELVPQMARDYAAVSFRTIARDIEELKDMQLVVERGGKLAMNLGLLVHQLPQRRKKSLAA